MKVCVLNFNRMGKAILLNPKTLEIYSTNSENVKHKKEYVWCFEAFLLALILVAVNYSIFSYSDISVKFFLVILGLFISYKLGCVEDDLFQINFNKKNINKLNNLSDMSEKFGAERLIEIKKR